MSVYYFFKIFNNIKSSHESGILARIELESLFGKVDIISNVMDLLLTKPFSLFTKKGLRIQDALTMELPYGSVHGYYAKKDKIENISFLLKRLAYTREIYVVVEEETSSPEEIIKKICYDGTLGRNIKFFEIKGYTLFRIITNQFYLEKSQYISKLSRNEEEVDKNIETLSSHLYKNQMRIPASSTMAVGKRMIDYFAIREEPSLYLNHYMHPYKGKFHPKMVRSLINYVLPKDQGCVLDNFCGSGTTLVEAGYMGLDSLGVEINPLSALMCNVKTNSIRINHEKLKETIEKLLKELEEAFQEFSFSKKGQSTLTGFIETEKNNIDKKATLNKISAEAIEKIKQLKGPLQEELKKVEQIILTREKINEFQDGPIKDFLMLSLSGTISDVNRRTRKDFIEAFNERLYDLYLRIYLFNNLNNLLKIQVPSSITYVSDTREMKEIEDESVDAIVNSPPYSTALDYIRNDEPQLILLNLVDSFDELEKNMMGNPRVNFDRNELSKMIVSEDNLVFNSSTDGKKYVKLLMDNNRTDAGLRVFKFFMDMYFSLKEMFRVQKKGSKCAIVIGNNHFKVNDFYEEIANDVVLEQMGISLGYQKDRVVHRELQKSSAGNIRKESIIFLLKPE